MTPGPDTPADVLLIGTGRLARGADECLRTAGRTVVRLREPTDRDVRSALDAGPRVVLVATVDDIIALRYALLVEFVRPGVRLIVTIFDRTVASQVRRAVRNCVVVSAADLAVPALIGPCVSPDLLALGRRGDQLVGVAKGPDGPVVVDPGVLRSSGARRARGWLRSQLRPHGAGARMLVVGLCGLVAILVLDTVLALGRGEGLVEGWYSAVKTVATVGPNAGVDDGSDFTRVAGSLSILAAAVFFAAFTAGLVQRILSRRLIGIVGRRTVPRDDHVVVVGLGHFGYRLCVALQDLGLPVVAVERNADAANVRNAKRRNIPVVLADGSERGVLERLSLGRARALAASTSDDLTNISVAVAALAVRPDVRVVLRAFEGAVTEESQALFHIGVVRDVFALAASSLASIATGGPSFVATYGHAMYAVEDDGTVRRLPWPDDMIQA
jgi:hypothetical protein